MATGRHRQSLARCSGIKQLAVALALLFTEAEEKGAPLHRGHVPFDASRCFMGSQFARSESSRMSYRIERSTNARGVTLLLSGEMDANAVVELEALIAAESSRLVFLDLADVTLVHEEAIQLLAGVEAAGAVLMNCPEYVRSWIEAQQDGA